jgi:hypothetical protein
MDRGCANFCPWLFKRNDRSPRVGVHSVITIDFTPNASRVFPTRKIEIRVTLENDCFVIETPQKRKVIMASEILRQYALSASAGRPAVVHWILKSRNSILIECSEELFSQIPPDPRSHWRIDWTGMWAARKMSTFAYLINLNLALGRAFEDIRHYPIMPRLPLPSSPLQRPDSNVVLNHLNRIEPFSQLTFTPTPTDCFEIVPEFYFHSRVCPFTEVYRNRRKLESDETGEVIGDWIGQAMLFSDGHPPRARTSDGPLDVITRYTDFDRPSNAIISSTRAFLFSKAGTFIHAFDGEGCVAPSPPIDLSDHELTVSGRRFCAARRKDSTFVVFELENGLHREISVGNHQIAAIAKFGHSTALAMKDTIVQIFDNNLIPTTIFTYLSGVTCIDCNPTFDQIAVGDKSGTLAICSVSKRRVTASLQIPDRCTTHVCITESWGLICVAAISRLDSSVWLYTYTVDGEKVAEVLMPRQITALRSFVSTSGFDWIVVADIGGFIFVTDAVKIDVATPAHHVAWPVRAVGFNRAGGEIIIADDGGNIVALQKEWN